MILDRHAKYRNRKFWVRVLRYVTVGHNEGAFKSYIRNQLQEDKHSEQMSMKEFINPFTGKKIK